MSRPLLLMMLITTFIVVISSKYTKSDCTLISFGLETTHELKYIAKQFCSRTKEFSRDFLKEEYTPKVVIAIMNIDKPLEKKDESILEEISKFLKKRLIVLELKSDEKLTLDDEKLSASRKLSFQYSGDKKINCLLTETEKESLSQLIKQELHARGFIYAESSKSEKFLQTLLTLFAILVPLWYYFQKNVKQNPEKSCSSRESQTETVILESKSTETEKIQEDIKKKFVKKNLDHQQLEKKLIMLEKKSPKDSSIDSKDLDFDVPEERNDIIADNSMAERDDEEEEEEGKFANDSNELELEEESFDHETGADVRASREQKISILEPVFKETASVYPEVQEWSINEKVEFSAEAPKRAGANKAMLKSKQEPAEVIDYEAKESVKANRTIPNPKKEFNDFIENEEIQETVGITFPTASTSKKKSFGRFSRNSKSKENSEVDPSDSMSRSIPISNQNENNDAEKYSESLMNQSGLTHNIPSPEKVESNLNRKISFSNLENKENENKLDQSYDPDRLHAKIEEGRMLIKLVDQILSSKRNSMDIYYNSPKKNDPSNIKDNITAPNSQ